MVIIPLQAHWIVDEGCNAGAPSTCIFGEPPFHAEVIGMQDTGVSVPKAAAVAAATDGLAGDPQKPRDEMFSIGIPSFTFAARVSGTTYKTPIPPTEQLQLRTAPEVTIGSVFRGGAAALAKLAVELRNASTRGAAGTQIGMPFSPATGRKLAFLHALKNRPAIPVPPPNNACNRVETSRASKCAD